MRRALTATAAIVLIVLSSCGDTAIFLSPVEEPAEVRIETIVPGSILVPGSEIPLEIARDPVFTGDPESADRLVVELLDTAEVVLGEQVYESVDQAETLPALLLPDLGEGIFVLRASYFDGETLIESEDIPFFISSGTYSILGLSTYPATLYPGSAGLLSLNFESPPGSDPYIQWYLDDTLIESGFVSETGATLQVQAPAEIGAYRVLANLYPTVPVADGVEAPPVVSYSSQLLVTTELTLDEGSLTPEWNYFSLFHFLGDLRDDGARMAMFNPAPGDAEAIGTPRLAIRPDIFGFQLSGADGLRLDGFLLPILFGELGPFSVTLRLHPDAVDQPGEILRVFLEDEDVMALTHDSSGRLIVSLGGSPVLETIGGLQAGRTSVVTATVMPLGEFTHVQVYLDGELLTSETTEWDARKLGLPLDPAGRDDGWMQADGFALVGGENGFVGIVDELGVYFRDDGDRPSADTDVFRSAMEQVLGDKLVYAEGFESAVVPDGVEADGDVVVDAGRLTVPAGSSVLFPVFGFDLEELLVTVSLDDLDGSVLRFATTATDGPAFVFVPGDYGMESGDLEFRFDHSLQQLTLNAPLGDAVTAELDPGVEFTGLRLEVQNAGDDTAKVAVQSIVAWRENPRLPESILELEVEVEDPNG